MVRNTKKPLSEDLEGGTKKQSSVKGEIYSLEDKIKNEINSKTNLGCLLTDLNLYLFHKGCHYESYKFMGAQFTKEGRRKGVRFTTWAPNASSVVVVGDFSNWQTKEEYSMQKITEVGLWSIFIPAIKTGEIYKYAVKNKDTNKVVLKSDPYAFASELRPNNGSIVTEQKNFRWGDKKWVTARDKRNIYASPINIYELHLQSWKMKEGGGFYNYRELTPLLVDYVKKMGYTHVELMPVMEHPLDDSWGYQVTGYYSVTSRLGNREDFQYLVNTLHKNNIGIILDWVPGHFCKDEHGLYKFDGTSTYEYKEESKAENRGWGAANFDLGRTEVKSFLISNALYWLREFHIDGLRVDAVANMLYLDYERNYGEWAPNKYGENGNLEAIQFIKELNTAVFKEFPKTLMIAEESTTWKNVTKPVEEDGLGFNFKWNMGWMNDVLQYIQMDPIYRKYHHGKITFSTMYKHTENFILSISHDEVVHGKKSLVDKMWGDYSNKFAGLRLFMAFMMGHPGKKTLFMGCEFGQFIEWKSHEQLEWKLINEFDMHRITNDFFSEINNFYRENKALWENDYDDAGFSWIDADNADQSILVFMRKAKKSEDTLIFICNFTPMTYEEFKIGVPYLGIYEQAFNTDSKIFGGSNVVIEEEIISQRGHWHNQEYYLNIKIPPMAAVILKPTLIKKVKDKKIKK